MQWAATGTDRIPARRFWGHVTVAARVRSRPVRAHQIAFDSRAAMARAVDTTGGA